MRIIDFDDVRSGITYISDSGWKITVTKVYSHCILCKDDFLFLREDWNMHQWKMYE